MSNLALIDNVLNSDFKCKYNTLVEKNDGVKMSIDCVTDNCQSFIFEFDIQLDKSFSGGFFPFFSNNQGVKKRCDYIIFSELKGQLFALIIELKAGQQGAMPQLNAGECFVDYVIDTVNRVNKTTMTIEKRKISIREFERKKKTKLKEIEYDKDNHHFFEQKKFRIISYLK